MLPISSSSRSTIVITCAKGVSHFLRRECEEYGFAVRREWLTGVAIEGSMQDTMRLNLHLATGHRILFLADEFSAATADDLYARITSLPWEKVIAPDEYLSVTSKVFTDSIHDSRFANLRCKDAIVDRLVGSIGRRCNSGPSCSGVVVHLHWKKGICRLYIDTTGAALSKRGYRRVSVAAPLQETLAAAIVRAMGFDGSVPFVNPMCGSGTLAIEAAICALRQSPCIARNNFAFMHLRWFRPEDLVEARAAVQSHQPTSPPAPIVATDIDPKAIEAARTNAQTAGVEQWITFGVGDFSQLELPKSAGIIVMNPPYGKRIGSPAQVKDLYRRIGGFFKHSCVGWRGAVLTGNFNLPTYIGLKARRKWTFTNGNIPCRLYEYDLYHSRQR